MDKFSLYHSATFDRKLAKFNIDFQRQVNNIEDKLIINPEIGKPLNVKWFREKKINKYRIYYLIYEDLKSIFMVDISEKKDQQKIINTIRLLFNFFKIELKDIINNST